MCGRRGQIVLRVGRQQHDHHIGVGRLDAARGLDAVDARHVDVHEHEVGARAPSTNSPASSPDSRLADHLEPARSARRRLAAARRKGPDRRRRGLTPVFFHRVHFPPGARNRAMVRAPGRGWSAPLDGQEQQHRLDPPVDVGLLGQPELGEDRVDVLLDGPLASGSAPRRWRRCSCPRPSRPGSPSRGVSRAIGDSLAAIGPPPAPRPPWGR